MTLAMSGTEQMAELLRDAGQYLAGGGLGLFQLPDEVNLVITEGHGSHVTDVAGKDYIDYHLGSGPSLLGHGNPEITAAVAAQLPKGTTYYFLNVPAVQLAEKLVQAIPCGEVVHYMGSGTEATFFAMRIARAKTGRNKVMKFEGGWHGMHDYALWGTTPSRPSNYPNAEPDTLGIPDVIRGQVLVAPFNDSERAEAIIEANSADLAAVIVEPLERVLVPQPGFLESLREACDRHGVVLIFDEVVTGFRVAYGGAQEKYGVLPDMATYGKAMAGGFAMAAVVGKRDVMNPLDSRVNDRAHLAWASGTLNGNPVAATAGLTALEILGRPGAYDVFHRVGGRLRRELKALGEQHGIPTQTPGEDAVFGVRFSEREEFRSWEDQLTHDKDMGLRWGVELLKRGILNTPNEKFYISIAHTDADVDRTLEAANDAFKAVKR